MRLSRLTIAGFRGFNEERTIDFDSPLILLSAPNSHGKTSITEALEFLFFGETSKVAHAQSREEYRDSYRNTHWPRDKAVYIEASVLETDGTPNTLRIELQSSGGVRRLLNGQQVAEWPFAQHARDAGSPFVLQHALKYLLLVAPNERFQGFARLLGLEDVDQLQKVIVSLCTKPEATIPPEGKRALADLVSIESRLDGITELQKAGKDLKKGLAGITAAYAKFDARAGVLLGKGVPAGERLANLVRIRDELAAKVFSGTVALRALDEHTRTRYGTDSVYLASAISTAFLEDWGKLMARAMTERLAREAELLRIGSEIIAQAPDSCPLCQQSLNENLRAQIDQRREVLLRTGAGPSITDVRSRVNGVLRELQESLARHRRVLDSRAHDLRYATSAENGKKVAGLFGDSHEVEWRAVRSAADALVPVETAYGTAAAELTSAISSCEVAIATGGEAAQAESLGTALNSYLRTARDLEVQLDRAEPTLVGPARILRQKIDELAGSTELTLLIELLEKKPALRRALKIRDTLGGLKDLKRAVEQTVGETMETAISAELTGSVMDWYGRIRTKGDPNVHFSGFAMERTKDGDFKKGKVSIGASSYGVGLASAVSSLSESKLNALGLCVSIASALRAPGPWEFLVLDDPIQSWDADHEVQFVEVIRALIEDEGRQVILLTHKADWARQVSAGCRTLNGLRYEITGYTKAGPNLKDVDWATVDQRLGEAESIANDRAATDVRLQQAEEEIRLAACQLASEIALRGYPREYSTVYSPREWLPTRHTPARASTTRERGGSFGPGSPTTRHALRTSSGCGGERGCAARNARA
jgi:hypothetical protein